MKAVYPMVTDNYNTRSYTEDFTNAFWSKYFSTITANSIVAPNGTLTGETLNEDNTTNPHSIYSDSSSLANTQYTSSIYVKAGTRRYVQLAATPNANDWAACIFDTTNPSFTKTQVSGNVTATFAFSAEANGWYRLSITWTCTVSGIASPLTVALIDVPTPTLGVYAGYSYTGNGSNVYVWGAQTQLGGLTQYQPIATTPSAFMASQMKYNLKDARDLDAAFRLTWSGGWTYSATGATPNGTNAYADTRFNLLTNLPGYNNSFSVYFRQNLYGTYKVGASGSSFDRGMSAHLGWTNSSGTLYHDNLGRNTMANSAYGTFDAYHISSVTSTSSQKLYRNGVMKLSGAATVGLTQPSINFYFGASNDNGTANYFDPKQIAFGTLSTSLTDQDAQLLNQIVEKYQVALSRGVQAAQSFYYNSAYSNEANTYLYSTQITGTTQVSAINTLINGLKANNLWTKMKAVYPFVTDKWNLLGYTEDFTNAAWSKGGGTTVTANTTTAPDGTTTADTVVLPNTGTIAQSLTNTANTQTIFSIYLRASANTTIKIGFFSPGTVVTCNVTTEWQRFTITHTYSGTAYPQIYNDTGATVTLFVWGAQAEYNSSATTYQAVLGANSYASNVAAQMKFNLVNPQDTDAAFRLSFSGGWTYSTNGAQPNGTNGYADTKLVPSTSLSTSSAHFSKYNRTNDLVGNKVDGSIGGTSTFFFQQNYSAGNGIIGEVASIMSYTPTDTRGLFTSTRTSTSLAKQFRNSNQVASATTTITGMSDRSMFIGARNDATITFYNSYQAAFASIGDGLSDAEVALLNQLVTEYQTTLSRNV